MRHYMDLAPEVAAALAAGRPVVALESTVIRYGLPYPDNLAVAREVEAAVRQAGAVPATVAVLDGRIRVGCGPAELERLARGQGIAKASLRDLPVLLASGGSGATTVAATATVAAAAGIAVFATGGIGGVHRGAARTWDVSADLTVLGREPVAVVCSGAKTVLDIPATLEALETLGVTVLGYGTDRFPGFYVRETPHPVDRRVDTPREAAAVVWARRRAGLPGAVLVCNPVPPAAALDPQEVEAALADALAEAQAQGVAGRDVTPYLLARLRERTGGRSLAANRALLVANAALAAQVAAELRRLDQQAAVP